MLLDAIFSEGSDIHLRGLSLVLSKKDIDKNYLINFIQNNDIITFLTRITSIVNIAPFILYPDIDLIKLWREDRLEEYAQFTNEIVFQGENIFLWTPGCYLCS